MKFFHIFMLLSFSTITCFAQKNISNTAGSFSELSIGAERRLYYGKEYTVPSGNIKGTRSFMDFNYVDDSKIVYEGVMYDGVMLMYDIVRDDIIVRDLELLINICLIKPFITSFSINGYEFLQVFEEKEGLMPGFYYKVYDSENFTVYGRRSKNIQEYASGTIRERRVNESLNLFFKSKDASTFLPITGRRNFLRNFGSDRKEINRYMRDKAMLYRDDPEAYVQSILDFVDETKER